MVNNTNTEHTTQSRGVSPFNLDRKKTNNSPAVCSKWDRVLNLISLLMFIGPIKIFLLLNGFVDGKATVYREYVSVMPESGAAT